MLLLWFHNHSKWSYKKAWWQLFLTLFYYSRDISSSCNKYAFPSLCFSAFPLCIDPQQSNRYQEQYLNKYNKLTEKDRKTLKDVKNKLALQRICKEDCKLLETELCGKEYAIAKRHPVIGKNKCRRKWSVWLIPFRANTGTRRVRISTGRNWRKFKELFEIGHRSFTKCK